jgi:predicted outer membrane repeat protein
MEVHMRQPTRLNILFIFYSLTGLLTLSARKIQIEQQDRVQTSFFVAPGGSGSTCLQASPCTLQTALDNVVGGEIIYLASGTYQKASPATEVILLDKSIQVYGGWNGQTGALLVNPDNYVSIIDGQDARRCIKVTSGGAGSKLSGLTFMHGYANPFGGGMYTIASSLTITRSIFRDNVSGSAGGGIYLVNDGGLTISNTRFEDNRADDYGGAISASSGSALEVSKSEFKGNTASNGAAINIDRGSVNIRENVFDLNYGYQTVHTDLGSGYFLFVNNMITNSRIPGTSSPATGLNFYQENVTFGSIFYNTFVGHAKAIDCDYGDPIFMAINNIFANNGTSVDCESTNLSLGYNLFHGNTSDPYQGNAPVIGDPKFVDPANADYHISAGSAALDTAGNINVLFDFEGDARPTFANYDIGADELCLQVYLPLITR